MPTLRRARQVAHAREQILRAAARVFARHGLDAATMHDIAKEAGYTVASLYAYFKGKQEIVEGLITFLAQGLLGPLDNPSPPGLTFAQRVELVLRRQLEFAEDLRDGLLVFFAFKSDTGRPASRRRGKIRIPEADLYVRRLSDWIARTARPDEIGGRQPEDVAYVLKGVQHAVFLQWLHGGTKGRLSDRAAAIVDLFLHGIAGRPPTRERSGA